MSPLQRLLLAAMIVLTICRWIMGALLELSPAEASLWMWSQHWSVAGYDGGGLAALLVKFSAGTLGHSPFGVRFFAPLCAAGTSWLVFRTAISMSGEKAAAWAVLLLNLLPAFQLGSVFLLPEWLAVTAGMSGTLLMWRALHRAGKWDWRWPAAGGCWGVALLADWSALWLPLAGLFAVLSTRRWRGRWKRPGIWLMLGTAILTGWVPLLWWNAGHAGASWFHLLDRWGLAEAAPFRLRTTREMLCHCLLGASPLLLAAMLFSAVVVAKRWGRQDAWHVLFSFSFPALAGLLLVSLAGVGEANLLIPALPPLVILLALQWEAESLRGLGGSFKWAALVVAAGMSLLAINSDLLRRAGFDAGYSRDASRHWKGWSKMAAEAATIISEAQGQAAEGLFIIASDWRLASVLNFYLPPETPGFHPDKSWPLVQVMESPAPTSQYAFWPRYDQELGDPATSFQGKTALFFTDAASREGPPASLERAFEVVEPLMVFDVRRSGHLVRRVRVFACRNYSGLPL